MKNLRIILCTCILACSFFTVSCSVTYQNEPMDDVSVIDEVPADPDNPSDITPPPTLDNPSQDNHTPTIIDEPSNPDKEDETDNSDSTDPDSATLPNDPMPSKPEEPSSPTEPIDPSADDRLDNPEPIDPPVHIHELEYKESKSPKCTEKGNVEYWECKTCYKMYADSIGETEILDVEVQPLGHDEEADKPVSPTCTEAGLTGGSHCKRCNEVILAQQIIPALGHDKVEDKAVASTCTESGLTKGVHCKRCNEVILAQQIIPALGHDKVEDKAVDPTCTESGLTKGSHCKRCNEVILAQQTIPATGHKRGEKKTVPPTCEKSGESERICENCGTRETEKIDATGVHEYSTEWKYDSEVHYREAICGCERRTEQGAHEIENGECKCGYIDESVNRLSFEMTDEGYIVTGIANMASTEVTIPSTYKGQAVVGIGDEAFIGKGITSIKIPRSVQTIGIGAFADCDELDSATIENKNNWEGSETGKRYLSVTFGTSAKMTAKYLRTTGAEQYLRRK